MLSIPPLWLYPAGSAARPLAEDIRCSSGYLIHHTEERALIDVRIALCGLDLGVTQDALNLIQAAAAVHQKVGEAVLQVVDTHIVQSGLTASDAP